jgi:hypothetical protein
LLEECKWDKSGQEGTDRMDRATKNIMMAEQRVRQTTSDIMKKNINDQVNKPENRNNPHFKPDLREVQFEEGKEYRIDQKRLEKELKFLFTGDEEGEIAPADQAEYDDAINLFKATQSYLNEDYMNDFAEKLRMNGKPEKFFPFAIAAEELDTSFLTYQSVGPDVMRRALSEIGSVETNVVKNIQENFIMKLRDVAMHEHKFDPLVHAIHEVHKQLDSIHGEEYANEVADYMARLATAYFKKDSDSIGPLGKLLNVGKPHSLAGHFAGGSWKNVWEWDVAEQDSFYRELDKLGILPDRPVNMNKPEEIVPKKFLGLTYGYKKVILESEPGDPEHSGLKIRKDMGARYTDIGFEIMRKYLFLAIGAILAIYIARAFKEASEKK